MPLVSFDKKTVIYGAIILTVAAVVFFAVNGSLMGAPLATYSNPAFRVELDYPYDWAANPAGGAFQGIPLYFGGFDGYFGIDAIAGEASISLDDVASALVLENINKPYGSDPKINSVSVQGMEAMTVFPSDDQLSEARNEAIIIIRYPEPIIIGDASYPFFMLYADKHHLEGIVDTLRFISAEEIDGKNEIDAENQNPSQAEKLF